MTKKLKITRRSGNVLADTGFDKDEVENLKLRAELMMSCSAGSEQEAISALQQSSL
jgi:predicted XRE-type DNA-binding protein